MKTHPGKTGTLAGFYQQGCTGLAALVSYRLIRECLDDHQAGIWFVFQAFLVSIMLTDFGVSFVITRQIAFSLFFRKQGSLANTDFIETRPGWDGVADVVRLSRTIVWWTSMIVLVLAGVVYLGALYFSKMGAYFNQNTAIAWGFLGIALFSAVQAKTDQSLIEGLGRVDLTRFIVGTCQGLMGAGFVLILCLGAQLPEMAMMMASFTCLQFCALRMCARFLAKGRLSNSQRLPKDVVFRFLKIAWPVGLMNLSSYLVSCIQVPLLGWIKGPEVVPAFYLAQKIGQTMNQVVSQIVSAQLPLFTHDLAAGGLMASFRRMKRIILFGTVTALVINLCYLWGSPILARFLAPAKGYVDLLTLGLMGCDYFIMASAVVVGQFVLASGRNPFLISTLLNGVLNIVFLAVLYPLYGLVGIPLASLSSGLLTNYWYNLFKGYQLMKDLKTTR